MKKYPFKKKFIHVMAASALLATPIATIGPIGETSIAIAQQVEKRPIIDVINEKLEGQEVNAEEILKAMAEIVYATELDDLQNAIDDFRENYRDAFHIVFDNEQTVDDLIQFVLIVENEFKELGSDEVLERLLNEGYYPFMDDLIDDLKKEHREVSDLESTLKEHLGVELIDVVMMKEDLDSELGLSTTQRINIKKALAEAVKEAEDVPSTGDSLEDLTNRFISIYEEMDDDAKENLQEARNALREREVNWEDVLGEGEFTDQDDPSDDDNDSESGGGSTPTDPDDEENDTTDPSDTEITLDEDMLDFEVVEKDGEERAVSTVDSEKFQELLDEHDAISRVEVELQSATEQIEELLLPMEVVERIKDHNEEAIVEVVATEGAIRLPVYEIDIETLREELGASFSISISIHVVENDMALSDVKVKSPVVQFDISALSDGNEVDISRFKQHVERDFFADKDFNKDRSVVVRVNEDGTLSAMPTLFDENVASFKSVTTGKYAVIENEVQFKDLPNGYWAEEEINKLASKFILQGRSDGTVAPSEAMTRAQMAVLITRSLGLVADGEYDNSFVDVDGEEWFVDELIPAIESGIVQGRRDGTFAPNEPVTRQQTAAMISRAMEVIGYDEADLDRDLTIDVYEDKEKIGDWAEEDVERLLQAGIMTGRENGTMFDPNESTQRAHMAVTLERFLTFVKFMN